MTFPREILAGDWLEARDAQRPSGVYDLSSLDDCVRLAVSQPSREHRIEIVKMVRRRCGEQAAVDLKDALKAMVTSRAA